MKIDRRLEKDAIFTVSVATFQKAAWLESLQTKKVSWIKRSSPVQSQGRLWNTHMSGVDKEHVKYTN